MDEREVYKEAIKVYGKDAQVLMAIEEMAELQNELCKDQRGRNTEKNIAEEIADVEIMLEQMKLIFGIERQASNWKIYKIKRLQERLEEQ